MVDQPHDGVQIDRGVDVIAGQGLAEHAEIVIVTEEIR